MIILIHTSKTMRPAGSNNKSVLTQPVLIAKARVLANNLKNLSQEDIEKMMKISPKLATTTKNLILSWNNNPSCQRPAIDSFLGDIYSGLQVASLTEQDRLYAHQHVRILSGLYGVLRPLDGIYPYRFEMGYRLPRSDVANLYQFWGSTIADTLVKAEPIVDLTAVEYSKTITKYIEATRIVTPRFLTHTKKEGQRIGDPVFVVVHAKIARGAFANWMIRNRIEDVKRLKDFAEIGYEYNEELSTDSVPVFICKDFKGLGLSVRLS
jgi:cytoplasmic iron level regulating protein YaaA (DUF328/UPF0246 family)